MTGTCRFCGQMRELNARSQADADEKASRSCDCAASGDYARKMATQEAVEEPASFLKTLKTALLRRAGSPA